MFRNCFGRVGCLRAPLYFNHFYVIMNVEPRIIELWRPCSQTWRLCIVGISMFPFCYSWCKNLQNRFVSMMRQHSHMIYRACPSNCELIPSLSAHHFLLCFHQVRCALFNLIKEQLMYYWWWERYLKVLIKIMTFGV